MHLLFTDEVVLLNGQKIGTEFGSQVFLRRPDRFRTIRHGVQENLDFYYDGKTVAYIEKGSNFYAMEPAPPTLDAPHPEPQQKRNIVLESRESLYSMGLLRATTEIPE